MNDAHVVYLVLGSLLVLFVYERWRYDIVALIGLFALVLAGIVPAETAFTGFSHPAVVTVAAVLVVSQGLARCGVVDAVALLLQRVGSSTSAQVLTLTAVVTVCSALMNNVGALALLMPVAMRLAQRHEIPVSQLLMPLAFGSLLGGMTTLIGTPPNLIVGGFRADTFGEGYGFFAYAPVGIGVAVVGVLFMGLFGWRLLPRRTGQGSVDELFQIDTYTVELRVPDDCAFDGKPLREFATADVEVIVVSVVRQEGKRALKPGADFVLRKGDQLTVEIDPDALPKLLARTGFELSDQAAGAEQMVGGEVELYEAVVMPRGRLVGKTVMQAELRSTLGLNVVGVARGGRRLRRPLREIRFEPGDVLLIQNRAPKEGDGFHQAGLLPLAPRTLVVNSTRRLVLGLSIFAGAVAMLAMGWMSAAVAFTLAGLLMVLTRLLRLEDAYRAIDMPIVVLLGAMIPVGRAFETTGGATQLAELLVSTASVLPAWSVVGLLLVLTMVLSDVMNNAATAVIMAPIAVHIAEALEASSDPFLMAVAIGASCAFLTPIGHQSNTLVMGPGGYRFSDYWRLGLPLELLIIVLGLPLLLWIWPLSG